MGTLFKQTDRDYNFLHSGHVEEAIEVMGLSDTDESRIKVYEILAYERRTDFMINNGDRHDEQMEGFGKILQGVCESVSDIADHMRGEG
jgi:hypothetical protein